MEFERHFNGIENNNGLNVQLPLEVNGQNINLLIDDQSESLTESHQFENGRQSVRLSKEGRQVAKENWEQILAALPPDASLEELDRQISDIFNQTDKAQLDDKPRRFVGLMERSARMRLERLKMLALQEELQATSPALEGFYQKLTNDHFPGKDIKFVRNMTLPWVTKIRREFGNQLSEYTQSGEDTQKLETLLLTKFFEDFNQTATSQLTEGAPISLDNIAQEFLAGATQAAPESLAEGIELFTKKYHPLLAEVNAPEFISSITAEDIPSLASMETERSSPSFASRVSASLQKIFNRRTLKAATLGGMLLMSLFNSTIKPLNASFVPGSITKQAFAQEFVAPQSNIESSGESKESVFIERNRLIEDETFVHPGSELHIEDMLYYADQLHDRISEQGNEASPSLIEKYNNTIQLLASAKARWPQAVRFQVQEDGGQLTMTPLDWQENVEVRSVESSDIVVVGGELESIATVIESAERGMKPILVYSGPLGGLISDQGPNMRYYDGVSSVEMTGVQKKLMIDALGMAPDNIWSIPDNVDELLRSYLSEKYPDIKIITTGNYNSLHANMENGRINNLVTQEGVQITSDYVVDTTTSAIIAEKAQIPGDNETINMAYGLVFDLQGITPDTLKKLQSRELLDPERIMAMAGLNRDTLNHNDALREKYHLLQAAFSAPTATPNHYLSYGYKSLESAFDFYMSCLESTAQDDLRPTLGKLNKERVMTTGFNISLGENGRATFNSLSYQFLDKREIRQEDHDLSADERFRDLREVEIPCLQSFLQGVVGEQSLKVVMPRQLYCRKANITYETLKRYTPNDFKDQGAGGLQMKYGFDVRGLRPKDARDTVPSKIGKLQEGFPDVLTWKIDPATTFTRVDNLFIVSKSGFGGPDLEGRYFTGPLRIGQNLLGTGYSLAGTLAEQRANEIRQTLLKASTGADIKQANSSEETLRNLLLHYNHLNVSDTTHPGEPPIYDTQPLAILDQRRRLAHDAEEDNV